MKTLNQLLKSISCDVNGNTNQQIQGIAYHSKLVKDNYLFVALNGTQTSGNKYYEQAIANGAIAFASDNKKILHQAKNKYPHITTIYTSKPAQFLARVANYFYDYPDRKLTLIGITGTDGKTTTSYLIKSIIETSGKKTGLIGTINYYDGKNYLPAPNTTPQSLDFIAFLDKLIKHKIKYCISEVSSHALALDRVYDLKFKIAIFTNLTKDHLDFHKTIKNYQDAKLKLFRNLSADAYAVVNYDDPLSVRITKNTKAQVYYYSLANKVDFYSEIITMNQDKSKIKVYLPKHKTPLSLTLKLPGEHNIANALAAIATAYLLKIKNHTIQKAFTKLKPIPGRLQKIKAPGGFNIYIDYAHTERALINALKTLRSITRGRVIVVFGCGGNRDKTKRPKMGCAASKLADYAIITSDNPRFEDPNCIIQDIIKGIKKQNYEIIVDRKEAIARALKLAQKDDTILLAGKGHEDYQIIGDKKIPFSDYLITKKLLKQIC